MPSVYNAKNQNVKNVKLKRINNKECKKSEFLINKACEVKMVTHLDTLLISNKLKRMLLALLFVSKRAYHE